MKKLTTLITCLLLGMQLLLACKCEGFKPLSKENLSAYEFIFSGRVVAVSACNEGEQAIVRFAIDTLYRGKAFAETDVRFDCSSSCAMSFAPGERWTIYATYQKYGVGEVSLCSPSRKLITAGTPDFYTDMHNGGTYHTEAAWLAQNLGIIPLNSDSDKKTNTRELIKPKGFDVLWLYLGGAAGVIALFFVLKRFLK
ncbi:MAG: hypothetical protein MUC87_13890 [Bacteroidia bacterium]|jgi:hypothetical protein|nr:hypothetical protein [Bacteroidia bacterium]